MKRCFITNITERILHSSDKHSASVICLLKNIRKQQEESIMKNIVLATVLSLTAAAAFANGAPTESYPNGYRPHADLSSVVQEAPRSNIIRAPKTTTA